MPSIKEWLTKKKKKVNGLEKYGGPREDEKLTFVNDRERIVKTRLAEYNVWYNGDGDELLNFYTGQNLFNYNYEPWYSRNKRNYYWSISSTENDIKRTHSGQARNIVDTLVSIMRFPLIRAGKLEDENNAVNRNLQEIIKDAKLADIYKKKQMPMTYVEGWGCYKINWDKDISDYPIPVYYRAANVDFIYKMGRIIGVTFKDYYTDGKGKKYMLAETRRIGKGQGGDKALIIENELFRMMGDGLEYINTIDFSEVPELAGTVKYLEIEPFNKLLAVPCVFYESSDDLGGYGRSIFTGKIDLFDDLDQALSQASNAVRKSTPLEYFNSEYMERDENGVLKQPHSYDRKYITVTGNRDANGTVQGDAVQVTQPNINFKEYSDEAVAILLQIINGVLSPATLGIDIAKKDNAEAQREKEKVTIFTRNVVIDAESDILKDLCSQLLCAYEFMHKGEITVKDYEIGVQFSEFADDSFENKIEKLGAAFDAENISEEMFMKKLYGDTLSRADYEKELAWLKEHHTKPRDEGMQGFAGGGMNVPGTPGPGAMMDEEEI